MTPITQEQALKILKAAVYVGLAATIDALISLTAGTDFGLFTVPVNLLLVTLKQLFTDAK